MGESVNESSGVRALIRNLCFTAFGVTIFFNPLDPFNLYNIGIGIIICLMLGMLYKKFLRGFMSLFNPIYKKENNKKSLFHAIDNGILFLVPFALMTIVATFYLKWSITSGFISTGFMAVGTAVAIEIGKLKGKQELKNTIVNWAISFLFSFILLFSVKILAKAPGLVEGITGLIYSFLTKGGGKL